MDDAAGRMMGAHLALFVIGYLLAPRRHVTVVTPLTEVTMRISINEVLTKPRQKSKPKRGRPHWTHRCSRGNCGHTSLTHKGTGPCNGEHRVNKKDTRPCKCAGFKP